MLRLRLWSNKNALIVGWSTAQQPVATYDQGGVVEPHGDSIKARLITLISAVRTLLRCKDLDDILSMPLDADMITD